MADTKISAETTASALTGAEQVPVVQGGNNRKTTTLEIARASDIIATFDGTTSTVATVTAFAGAASIVASISDGDVYEFTATLKKTTSGFLRVILTKTKNATDGYIFQLNTTGAIQLATASTSLRLDSAGPNNLAGWITLEGRVSFGSASNYLLFRDLSMPGQTSATFDFTGGPLWCAISNNSDNVSANIGKVVFRKVAP